MGSSTRTSTETYTVVLDPIDEQGLGNPGEVSISEWRSVVYESIRSAVKAACAAEGYEVVVHFRSDKSEHDVPSDLEETIKQAEQEGWESAC